PFRSYRPPDTGSVPIDPMLEQSLRNRFSLVARRVSLGLLLSIGWLFTEGLFPPTRSSALTISQFQRLDPTRNGPVCDRRFFILTFRGGDSSRAHTRCGE